MAKASIAEVSARGFFLDTVNPVEVGERLAGTLRAARDEGPPTISKAAALVIFAPLPTVEAASPASRNDLLRGDDRGPRLPPRSSSRLLTQTEQPRLSLSFQGTERAERATARRAKLTPR